MGSSSRSVSPCESCLRGVFVVRRAGNSSSIDVGRAVLMWGDSPFRISIAPVEMEWDGSRLQNYPGARCGPAATWKQRLARVTLHYSLIGRSMLRWLRNAYRFPKYDNRDLRWLGYAYVVIGLGFAVVGVLRLPRMSRLSLCKRRLWFFQAFATWKELRRRKVAQDAALL